MKEGRKERKEERERGKKEKKKIKKKIDTWVPAEILMFGLGAAQKADILAKIENH